MGREHRFRTGKDAGRRTPDAGRRTPDAGRRTPDAGRRTPDAGLLQYSTLWDYPFQNYGERQQGDPAFPGATPSYVVWNLLVRYTKEKDLVVDPFAGSGTTLDVARELCRRALGYDVHPVREDVFRADARKLPLEDEKADFVFMDPPYSTHLRYSDDPRCIGRLDASGPEYFEAMEKVFGEVRRVLRPGGHVALYVSDTVVGGRVFVPIGFELHRRLLDRFEPVDIVCVVRHNRALRQPPHQDLPEGDIALVRGFNYLFVLRKAKEKRGEKRGEKRRGER